jgi:hypothetical protein
MRKKSTSTTAVASEPGSRTPFKQDSPTKIKAIKSKLLASFFRRAKNGVPNEVDDPSTPNQLGGLMPHIDTIKSYVSESSVVSVEIG